jgi:hypothetical protein
MTEYYNVSLMYGAGQHLEGARGTADEVVTHTLEKARDTAKAWCREGKRRKYYQDRAAVISKRIKPGVVKILETYVEDVGGSGRAVCTRSYNAKTGRSKLL